jgi:DNA polymerase-1
VARWRRDVVVQADRDTYVTTVGGRRRYVPELFSNDPDERAYGERICVNTPIQGSAADLCKVAMVNVHRALRVQRRRGVIARNRIEVVDRPVEAIEPGPGECGVGRRMIGAQRKQLIAG